jgi:peptidoglycan/xylan/chitin deacetylase (PgdA/CDA1 family)
VLLSFDDGFHSNLIVAERILSRYQAQALFFVCPGLMDQPTSAQRGLIASQIFEDKIQANDIGDRRLLTWGEAARLLELGHVIGSHSLSHRRLSRLAPDEIETEVGEAAAMLRRRGFSAEWFAFPFGDVASISPVALATIAKHHLLCRSGVRGINSPRGNPLTLCADHVDLDADPPWRNLAAEGALGLVYGSARRSLAKYARLASEHAHDVLTKTARAE